MINVDVVTRCRYLNVVVLVCLFVCLLVVMVLTSFERRLFDVLFKFSPYIFRCLKEYFDRSRLTYTSSLFITIFDKLRLTIWPFIYVCL